MKYSNKRNRYEASNVYYNSEYKEGRSYNWWKFVSIIEGKTVFNEFRYSMTTQGHQRKVKTLMKNLGHKIDLLVSIPDSLNDISNLEQLRVRQEEQKEIERATAEQKRLERNKKAKERRLLAKKTELNF